MKDIILRAKEQQRVLVLTGVLDGRYTPQAAAQVMGLSLRQVRRLKRALVRDGPRALAHGNRGRVPKHALAASVRAQVLALAQGRYARV